MSETIFRADSITKSFGARRVLNAATLWARRGSISALLGRNGSGKTTLFKIASGLMKADQGAIHFDGRVITRPRLHQLACDGVFVLPERDLLPRNDTIGTLLRLVADRFGTLAARDAAIELLRIDDFLDRLPHTLSGGERRRAELAMAVTRVPRVLLADEPFMGIDPKDVDTITAGLRQLAHDGCALVVTGHEIEHIMAVADEVVWITAGTTHSLGTVAQARNNWQFRREYLGAFDRSFARDSTA